MKEEIKENNETTIYDYKFVSIKDIKKQLQYKKTKEILEWLEREAKEREHYTDIDTKDLKLLLDYITNLQEENVVLKSQLLQDNKSYHDMQDRIKKAIEYTKTIDDWDIKDFRRNNILKILKGE